MIRSKKVEINITEKAAEQLKNMLQEQESSDKKIRVLITGIGWGGPRLGIALDEQKEDDISLNVDDLEIILHLKLVDSIKHLTIDYKSYLFS